LGGLLFGGEAGGTDTLSYRNLTNGIGVNVVINGAVSGGGGADTVSNFENLAGTNYNDTLTGDGNNNIIEGGDGDDTMVGGLGTDTLTYISATAGIILELGITSVQNTFGAGLDTVSGFENLIGSNYNDSLRGDSGNNVIYGLGGNDMIDGGAGDDTMDGGDGIDTVSYRYASSAVTVDLSVLVAQNTGGAGTDTIANFENIIGSNYNDTLTGNAGNNELTGGDGKDDLFGGDGDDLLNIDSSDLANTNSQNGGAGNDTLTFAAGMSVDTNVVENSVTNIEVLDLSVNGNHDLTNIRYTDIQAVTDADNDFWILGDSADNVTFQGADWSQSAGTIDMVVNGAMHTFYTYTNSNDATIQVYVESAILL
jgi:Ca2+-binding RTX toxin-like protein